MSVKFQQIKSQSQKSRSPITSAYVPDIDCYTQQSTVSWTHTRQ